MAPNDWPSADDKLRALIDNLERIVEDSKLVRLQVEQQLRERAFYPERRQPRRWERFPNDSDPFKPR